MDIEIETARSLEHALGALARDGADLRPVAGATDVVLRLEAGKLRAKRLLSVADVAELAFVRASDEGMEIGALARVADLLASPEIRRDYPSLAHAASEFASPQIRNAATLGGNIGNASPAADLVPPLIALGATLTLRSQKGTRSMPLEDFFVGPGKSRIAPDELIASVRLPRRAGAMQAFVKFGSRGANVISIVNFAACLTFEGSTIREARLCYGCCGPTPLRARVLEGLLAGQAVDERLIKLVSNTLARELKPIDDLRGSRRYKQLLAVHATEDTLAGLLPKARQAA
jgi:carbon-monoxide dehydrogenase medium subunit